MKRQKTGRHPLHRWIMTLVMFSLVPCAPLAAQLNNPNAFRDSVWKADAMRRDRALKMLGGQLQAMGFLKWSIPEYHDEQRFVSWPGGTAPPRNTLATAGSYGPIVNIYASPFLDDFTQSWQLEEHGERGVFAAVVYVDFTGTAAALPLPYRALSLNPGMNCLWLAHPNPVAWRGYISRGSGGQCRRDLSPAAYAPLRVALLPGGINAFPPVARFNESAEGVPLLGVKCLLGWCEIGPDYPGWTLAGTATPTSAPVRGPAGWADHQWLAQRRPNGTLTPLMFASVFPAVDIARHPVADYAASPILAAVVVLSTDPPAGSKYYVAGLRSGENQVFVRKVGAKWWMAIGSPDGPQLPADRMSHMDAGVPGTARWRYDSYDDGMWVPCGQACCRVSAFY